MLGFRLARLHHLYLNRMSVVLWDKENCNEIIDRNFETVVNLAVKLAWIHFILFSCKETAAFIGKKSQRFFLQARVLQCALRKYWDSLIHAPDIFPFLLWQAGPFFTKFSSARSGKGSNGTPLAFGIIIFHESSTKTKSTPWEQVTENNRSRGRFLLNPINFLGVGNNRRKFDFICSCFCSKLAVLYPQWSTQYGATAEQHGLLFSFLPLHSVPLPLWLYQYTIHGTSKFIRHGKSLQWSQNGTSKP